MLVKIDCTKNNYEIFGIEKDKEYNVVSETIRCGIECYTISYKYGYLYIPKQDCIGEGKK